MSKGIKILISLFVVAVVLFIGWNYLSRDKGAESGKLLTTMKTGNFTVGQEIIAELNELNSLKFDDSIFRNPIFASLRDFTVGVFPEEIGRQNPFAPAGASAALTASTSASKTNSR